MSDLDDLLTSALDHDHPSHRPEFATIVQRNRRSHRVRRTTQGVAVLGVGGVAAVVLLNRPSGGAQDSIIAVPRPTSLAIDGTCLPSDLALSVTWIKDAEGSMNGTLTATNPTETACKLLVKPVIAPNDRQGHSLPTRFGVTNEGRRGADLLLPGKSATARITWFTWCGAAAGASTHVSWSSEPAATSVPVEGALQPDCVEKYAGSGNQLSSTWFEGLSDEPQPTSTALAPETPPAVVAAAEHLSTDVLEHGPATVTYVRTTWHAWQRLSGEIVQGGDTEVYVLRLHSGEVLTCAACKGMGPTPKGTDLYLVIPVVPPGMSTEFTISNQDFGLEALDEVHVVGSSY